jgi:hypothetical protein
VVRLRRLILGYAQIHVEQVGQQFRPGGIPVQLLARQRAGRCKIDRGELRQPAEVLRRLLRCDRLDRHLQPRTDHLGDVAQGDALLADRMVARARLALLERQSEKPGGVGDVHGRQAVLALIGTVN